MIAEGYKCKFCKKPFTSERIFMKHECTLMTRSKEIQTIEGRMAYEYYKIWLQKQKRQAPPVETFITSTYYSSFFKFANWVRMTGIPQPDKYVELMIQGKISPVNWRRTEAYEIYNEFMDKLATPQEQAMLTAETFSTLAQLLVCEMKDVLSHFKVGQVLELIHQRRLSMWLLWFSSSFKIWYSKLDESEKVLFRQSINSVWWTVKLERMTSADRDEIKNIVEVLKI